MVYILGSHKQIGYSVLLSRWKWPRLKYLHIATSCENKYYSHYMQSAVEYTDIGLFFVFSNDPLQISHWTSFSVNKSLMIFLQNFGHKISEFSLPKYLTKSSTSKFWTAKTSKIWSSSNDQSSASPSQSSTAGSSSSSPSASSLMPIHW